MPPNEATGQEIARRLDEIATSVKDTRAEVMQELRDLRTELPRDYVRKDVLDALLAPLTNRVNGLENTNTWVIRTVGALVIAAVLGLVLLSGNGGLKQ